MRLDFAALTLDSVVITAFNVENSNYWLFGEDRRMATTEYFWTQYFTLWPEKRLPAPTGDVKSFGDTDRHHSVADGTGLWSVQGFSG